MTQRESLEPPEGPPRSVVRDELLECLQTLATIHDHALTPESLTAGLPLEQGRLTPGVFPRAAARAGLTAKIVKSRLVQLNSELFPAILLLEPGRACVLVSLDLGTRRARVIFPELGEAATEVSLDGLQNSYSGQAIYVRPRFHFDARGPELNQSSSSHWFWGVIRENRKLYRDVIAGSVVINLFAVAMPLFVLNVYDRVVPNHATDTLWVLAVGILIVLLFDLGLRLMRNSFVDLAASRADVKISSSLMEQVLGLRMEARPASSGSFSATLQSFESVRSFIGSAYVIGLVDLPFVLMFAAIIALIGLPLVIPVVIGVFFVLLYSLIAQGRLRSLARTTWRIGAQRSGTLVEAVANLETIKALRAEHRIQSIWEKSTAYLSRTAAQMRLISSSVSSVALWAQHTVAVCVVVIGVYLIIEGELTQGGLIAAYLLSSRAMAPVSRAASLLAKYHQAASAMRPLEEIMKRPVERPESKQFIRRPVLHGEIRFDRVALRYPNEERDALRDISFKLAPGEKVALLGRVGCGKTTINKLLMGLYNCTSGSVMIDGVDIRQMDPTHLRRHIGYVPQDVSLFFGSLRENIVAGGGSDDIDDEALLNAIKLSGLEELVNTHPSGVDLEVGERGQRLSGGQRQAVAIARAVVHDPKILLLDEPSSSMDQASEEALKAKLTDFTRGKTLVVVTHRTSLLSLVDRIVVIDAGKVVADGARDKVIEGLRKGQIGRAN